MITHQPGEIERLTRERDAARRDFERVADAAADLMGRLHGLVDSGELKPFGEMEAMELALATPHEDHP